MWIVSSNFTEVVEAVDDASEHRPLFGRLQRCPTPAVRPAYAAASS
jgi:hypothetical protein